MRKNKNDVSQETKLQTTAQWVWIYTRLHTLFSFHILKNIHKYVKPSFQAKRKFWLWKQSLYSQTKTQCHLAFPVLHKELPPNSQFWKEKNDTGGETQTAG